MADGVLTLKLDDATARRLRGAAEAADQPVDADAADLISEWLIPDDGVDEDLRIIEDYERTGVSYSLEEGLAVFDAAVQRRFEPKS
jgi:hypothetical protein